MSTLKIILEPNPKLHEKANEIIKFNEDVVKLTLNMKETMVKENGVGLAGPQIGENKRIFVVSHRDGVKAFINPKIYKKSLRTLVEEEGCLSVPGVFGQVKRSKYVWIRYFDEYGEEHNIKASGMYARIIQHENDHLDGILFIDKLVRWWN